MACDSWAIIFGVVPDDTSEWKPEMAPQAIVMNRNGNRGPGMIGPPPAMNPVTAGMCRSGARMITPIASSPMTPSFMNVER